MAFHTCVLLMAPAVCSYHVFPKIPSLSFLENQHTIYQFCSKTLVIGFKLHLKTWVVDNVS